jgi:hypothetical protein
MDENGKEQITAAQLQIERLIKLKLEKDKKEKIMISNAGNSEPEQAVEHTDETIKQCPAEKERVKHSLKKKAANSIKVEKRLFEKIHKLVNALNAAGGTKITKAKFVNIVLKEFIALGIDYSFVADKEKIKKTFERLKERS